MAGEAEIGSILREARERKNQSIQNAVEATKIRSKYLLALENGQFDLIPGQVYVKGFLRSYAKFLGLDGEELVNRLKAEAKAAAETKEEEEAVREVPPESVETMRSVLLKPARAARRENYLAKDLRRIGKALLKLLAAAVLIFAVATFAKSLLYNAPPTVSPPDSSDIGQNGGQSDTPDKTADGQFLTPPADSVVVLAEDNGKTIYGVSGDGIAVTITAEGSCWLGVHQNPDVLGNDFSSQVTLQSGENWSYSAAAKLSIRTGNPGVIKLAVNGVDLGVPGAVGLPKTLVFKKQ